MAGRINNYFNVKRDASKAPVKRPKTSLDPLEDQPRMQKPRNGPSPQSKSLKPTVHQPSILVKKTETPTQSLRKAQHKLKLVKKTSKLVATQVKPTQAQLPAHKRFAHLVQSCNQSDKTIISSVLKDVPVNAVVDVKPIELPIRSSPAKALFKSQSPLASPQKPYHPASEIFRSHANRVKNEIVLPTSVVVVIPSTDLRQMDVQSYSPRTTPLKAVHLASPVSKSRVIDESEIPDSLHLPFHMQALFELFRACDQVISTLHNRSEVCSFDKVKPAVQEIVRSDFSEKSVAQFSTVYHDSYFFRWDKQLDKITKLQLSTYALTLIPNLRNDGTQMAHDSPSKGHLVFTGTRLIQRRLRFKQSLIARVKLAHKEFLMRKFKLSESEVPSDSALRRWHPAFPLDTMVSEVETGPLPPRPSEEDNKITSASEAVAAFRARALFREADFCKKLCPTTETTPTSTPFIKAGTSAEPAKNLKGISESLLARVREREKKMHFSVLTRPAIPEVERMAYSALPTTITQVWRELRTHNGRPVPLAHVVARLEQSNSSGLSADHAMMRVEQLLELMPDWLEKVSWAKPHLRLRNSERSVKEVIEDANKKVLAKGIF